LVRLGAETTGYSDARARGGDWAFSEPTPQFGDHRKSRGPLRGKQYGDVGSAQAESVRWALTMQTAPLCSASRNCLCRVSDHRFDAAAKPVGRQQIQHFATHLLQLWLRGHDSAPNWGSCGKPPSSLYVRNGGAVSPWLRSRYVGPDDSDRSQLVPAALDPHSSVLRFAARRASTTGTGLIRANYGFRSPDSVTRHPEAGRPTGTACLALRWVTECVAGRAR
jgi:hypothetical protein